MGSRICDGARCFERGGERFWRLGWCAHLRVMAGNGAGRSGGYRRGYGYATLAIRGRGSIPLNLETRLRVLGLILAAGRCQPLPQSGAKKIPQDRQSSPVRQGNGMMRIRFESDRWDRRSGAVGAFVPDGLWVVKAAV